MRVALCQIPVVDDPEANLTTARAALAEAAGADLAVFPEAVLTRFGGHLAEHAQPLDGPFVTGLAAAARDHAIAVVAGVFEPADGGRVYNTAVVINGDGTIAHGYRKLHLFDAFGFRESDHVAPGDGCAVVDVAGLRCGLVTCYDVRFPELARRLVDHGAELLCTIAAWGSGPFKEEHWTTLVRARAIENTVWVAAASTAPDADRTQRRGDPGIGRSMLVDPLGVVRADLGPNPGVHVGEVDRDVTAQVRRTLPALTHRRRDVLPG